MVTISEKMKYLGYSTYSQTNISVLYNYEICVANVSVLHAKPTNPSIPCIQLKYTTQTYLNMKPTKDITMQVYSQNLNTYIHTGLYYACIFIVQVNLKRQEDKPQTHKPQPNPCVWCPTFLSNKKKHNHFSRRGFDTVIKTRVKTIRNETWIERWMCLDVAFFFLHVTTKGLKTHNKIDQIIYCIFIVVENTEGKISIHKHYVEDIII